MKTNNVTYDRSLSQALIVIAFCGGLLALAIFLMSFSIAEAAVGVTLEPGNTGSAVRQLQTELSADPSIYPEGLVTGFYGPLTQAAVERLQCRLGIVCGGTVATTGYGRFGPRTLAAVNASSGIGGSDDVRAPIMSVESVSTVSTGATVAWTTNEPSFSRVMWSTTFPFLYASAASTADANFDIAQTVSISGLQSGTTYFYVRESVDASGNVMLSTARTFRTN